MDIITRTAASEKVLFIFSKIHRERTHKTAFERAVGAYFAFLLSRGINARVRTKTGLKGAYARIGALVISRGFSYIRKKRGNRGGFQNEQIMVEMCRNKSN